jgi:hypothetical protein
MGFRNRLVGFFRTFLGIFLYGSNTHKNAFRVLCRLRISPAHSTVLDYLKDLGNSAKERLRKIGENTFTRRHKDTEADAQSNALAETLPDGQPVATLGSQIESYSANPTGEDSDDLTGPFMFLFDNVNRYVIPRSETVGNKNKLRSGTAATAVLLEDVPDGTFDRAPYMANVEARQRGNLTLKELYDDIDRTHLEKVGTGTVMRILVNNVPALKHLKKEVEKLFKDPNFCAKQPLEPRKSRIYPMGTSGINEGTAEGAVDVLDDLVGQMGIPHERFDDYMCLSGGDQMSMDRSRQGIHYLDQEESTYDNKSWVLPVIQAWHMGWAYLKSVIHTHWHDQTGKGTFGLRRSVGALGRNINTEICDYYPSFNALTAVFDSMVLSAVRYVPVLTRNQCIDLNDLLVPS